jgi:hypothetical protein
LRGFAVGQVVSPAIVSSEREQDRTCIGTADTRDLTLGSSWVTRLWARLSRWERA